MYRRSYKFPTAISVFIFPPLCLANAVVSPNIADSASESMSW